MADSGTFTSRVVAAMQKFFPEVLADKAWDNTGLLLDEAPLPPGSEDKATSPPTVLLTNDLSAAVVEEALSVGARMIVCYHPVIFKPLKSLTTRDPMQRLLLTLAAHRVSVYCPHTAVDAAAGGLNDWLCDVLLAGDTTQQASRGVPQPVQGGGPPGHEGAGYGREMELAAPLPLSALLRRLSAGIGGQRYVSLALPASRRGGGGGQLDWPVSRVAVCAGSGAGVLRDASPATELLVTGEMSHHDALRHTQLGQAVVTVFHSNSERAFLADRLQPMLQAELGQGAAVVRVSAADRDPFETVDVSLLS